MPTPARSIEDAARALAAAVDIAAAAASNEAQLRHALETALEQACLALGLTWTPFQLDRRVGRGAGKVRFIDVAHGSVVIEYGAPASLRASGAATALGHARSQAEEYVALLAAEEGREPGRYVAVVWDGASISFGQPRADAFEWDELSAFDPVAATRLLDALRRQGVPLVHPRLLAQLVGPESVHGARLLPIFFRALVATRQSAQASRTRLLFTEWRRLFGQVVGVQSDALRALLTRQGRAHGLRPA